MLKYMCYVKRFPILCFIRGNIEIIIENFEKICKNLSLFREIKPLNAGKQILGKEFDHARRRQPEQ